MDHPVEHTLKLKNISGRKSGLDNLEISTTLLGTEARLLTQPEEGLSECVRVSLFDESLFDEFRDSRMSCRHNVQPVGHCLHQDDRYPFLVAGFGLLGGQAENACLSVCFLQLRVGNPAEDADAVPNAERSSESSDVERSMPNEPDVP